MSSSWGSLVGGIGEAEASGEDAPMAGGDFTGVERDGDQLRLARPDLHPPSDQLDLPVSVDSFQLGFKPLPLVE